MATFTFYPADQDAEPITVKAGSWKAAITKALSHDDWHAWNTMGRLFVHRFSDGKLLGWIRREAA